MGCRLSGQFAGNGNGVKRRDLSHLQRREAQHILNEYEQPITVQMDDCRGRRHQWQYTSDCSTQTERHWEALRALGRVEGGGDPAMGGYAARPYYDHMAIPPDLYAANGYLPSVSYSVDDISRLDYDDDPEMVNYQPTSSSCLLGCCNTDQDEPSSFLSQSEYEGAWLDVPPGYLPLHELDSGLGCTDGSLHQEELSEPETDAISSPPRRGSSPSSESLTSSEHSDSGFHSISTGDFRHFHSHHGPHPHGNPRDQRAWSGLGSGARSRWDLESIPEAGHVPMMPQCSLGGSSIQFRARSPVPYVGRHAPRAAMQTAASSCRTEPCQRRALMMNQHVSMDLPGRSYTLHDLSDKRRASHPALPLDKHLALPLEKHLALPLEKHLALPLENQQASPLEKHPASPLGSHLTLPLDNHLASPLDNHLASPLDNHLASPLDNHLASPLDIHLALPLENYLHPGLSLHNSPTGHHNMGFSEERRRVQTSPSKRLGRDRDREREREREKEREMERGGEREMGGERERVGEREREIERERGRAWQCQFQTLGPPHPPGPCGPLYSTLDGSSPHGDQSGGRPRSGNPRAVRNQLLKARASQLADERSEVTTDEDVRGVEEWAGRYWSRPERRRHLALAREQRQRRASRGGAEGRGEDGAVAGGPGGVAGGVPGGAAASCSTVLELSHRKQSRLRNNTLLDDWTTVEELLTHGTRVGEGDASLCRSPLLSVTTV